MARLDVIGHVAAFGQVWQVDHLDWDLMLMQGLGDTLGMLASGHVVISQHDRLGATSGD